MCRKFPVKFLTKFLSLLICLPSSVISSTEFSVGLEVIEKEVPHNRSTLSPAIEGLVEVAVDLPRQSLDTTVLPLTQGLIELSLYSFAVGVAAGCFDDETVSTECTSHVGRWRLGVGVSIASLVFLSEKRRTRPAKILRTAVCGLGVGLGYASVLCGYRMVPGTGLAQ